MSRVNFTEYTGVELIGCGKVCIYEGYQSSLLRSLAELLRAKVLAPCKDGRARHISTRTTIIAYIGRLLLLLLYMHIPKGPLGIFRKRVIVRHWTFDEKTVNHASHSGLFYFAYVYVREICFNSLTFHGLIPGRCSVFCGLM